MAEFNITDSVDITDVNCPITFVKTKVALEELDDGDILEILLGPEAVDDGSQVIARDRYLDAFAQAGLLDDLVVAEIAVPFHRYAAYRIFLWIAIIDLRSHALLGETQRRGEEKDSGNQYLVQSHSVH